MGDMPYRMPSDNEWRGVVENLENFVTFLECEQPDAVFLIDATKELLQEIDKPVDEVFEFKEKV